MMRAKVIEVMNMTAGSFDTLVGSVALDGFENVDPATLPEQLQTFVGLVKEKLTAGKEGFEEVTTAVYEKYFNEAELDALLATLNSDISKKFRDCAVALQNDLVAATSKWRNETLDPHRDEIGKILGVVAPEPAEPTQAA